tara:strand:- start:905 stop:1333 length:429 start_codon:yes stop_codon:yes gene_type:complete
MKQLRKHIKEEISRLMAEEKYAAPQEISDTLKMVLKLDPLVRYVDTLKAANTIPPSYEVRLLNGKSFMIYYEDISLMIKIGTKDYYLEDAKELLMAKKHINKLLTDPIMKSSGEESEEEGEEISSGEALPAEEEPADEEPTT